MHLPTRISCILILKLLSHNQVPSFPLFYIYTSNPSDHLSLGSYLHWGVCYNCLSILVHPMCYCHQSPHIHLEALVAQINNKNIHRPNATCKCLSHNISPCMSNILCLKHENFGCVFESISSIKNNGLGVKIV
jgi:hypothetical protein